MKRAWKVLIYSITKLVADPLTGFVPITVVDSNFGNTYAIVGMMGFDNNKPAICYSLTKDTSDTMD